MWKALAKKKVQVCSSSFCIPKEMPRRFYLEAYLRDLEFKSKKKLFLMFLFRKKSINFLGKCLVSTIFFTSSERSFLYIFPSEKQPI
jgi:hypothetical protein